VQRAGGIVCFASVRDRFGDYGRVALATLRPPPPLAQSCLLSHTIWDFLGKHERRQEEASHLMREHLTRETDGCLCSALHLHLNLDPALTLQVSVASASFLFALSSLLGPQDGWSRSRSRSSSSSRSRSSSKSKSMISLDRDWSGGRWWG
jgi:hypothetical protein